MIFAAAEQIGFEVDFLRNSCFRRFHGNVSNRPWPLSRREHRFCLSHDWKRLAPMKGKYERFTQDRP